METGLKMFTQKIPEKDSDPPFLSREETGYVSKTYLDARPIYMPPVAVDIVKKIKHNMDEQAEERKR
jgi:hypothetical protein